MFKRTIVIQYTCNSKIFLALVNAYIQVLVQYMILHLLVKMLYKLPRVVSLCLSSGTT
jgi:hypothetical protein